ncbi:acyl-CoA dehydrogenase family protein [Cryptosporangium aurantiacum]|uniref:Acyl-CoA dehydrogenase n=1 Tax=Cryptosporangium aurantiacum TaxID=134849 RepID=A0A1M7PJC4_9ACTN|nr:acyl-CoA dehydrogenase family protein [Cryptosporangium aurantiacum]SHN17189.1 acyl-CoA dehydrogenase [Cryptosporangium aurantiacum]
MNFSFSDEQEQLRSTLRRLLSERASSERLREILETDDRVDRTLWSLLAGQLGLLGLGIPEEYGGAGFGPVETTVVFEELGRALAAVPYFSTIGLAVNALLAADDEAARKDLLPGIADGSTLATLAISERGGDGGIDLAAVTTTAAGGDGTWRLTGEKAFVTDGVSADLVLVVARSEAGLGLFAVAGDAENLARENMAPLDLTRPLARIRFEGTPARLVGAEGAAEPGLRVALDRAVAALAAEQAGGAARCLDMAVEYAKVREQFGRPIGSFQAIKHKAADMMVRVETAKSAAYYAAWAAADSSSEASLASALAAAYCADAYVDVAAENIQIHGGIGYTWEHDAHLYFRRAKSSQLLFGTPETHRDRLAALVGI